MSEPSGAFLDFLLGYSPIGGAALFSFSEYPSMTEKVLILSTYDVDQSSVAGSTEIASLPAVNVLDQEPTKVWRTENPVSQYLNISLAKPVVVDCAAFTWPFEAFSSSAQVRVKCYLSSAAMIADTSPALDTGWESVWPSSFKHSNADWGPEVGLLRWENTTAYRYVKLMFTDPGENISYLDISRVAVGQAIQFVTNPTYDGGVGYVPIDVQEPNGYGQVFTDPRVYQQRQFELVWAALADKAVKEDAMSLARLRGQAGDFYVFINPAAVEDFHVLSMQGLFESQHRFSPVASWMPDKDGVSRMGWSFTTTIIQKL